MISKQFLTDDQLASIGSVAIESTYLEVQLEQVLWKLAGMDEAYGVHFTSNMQMNSRIELIWTLGQQRFPEGSEARKDFKSLVEEIRAANVERNTIIHGYWMVEASDWRAYRAWKSKDEQTRTPAIAEKRRVGKEPIRLSAADIEAVAETISALQTMLITFLMEHAPDLVLDDDDG